MIVSDAAAGAWALAAHWVIPLRRRSLWWFTGTAYAATLVQILLGVWLLAVDDIEPPQLHVLYGFSPLIIVAIIYSYALQMRDRVYLLYGAAGLLLMGVGLRGVQVG